MRGDSGVAGEETVFGVSKFHSWGEYTKYQLRLDVQRFLCPVYYIMLYYIANKVTAPQDAQGRLVLQVYLGSNTLEFSAIIIIIIIIIIICNTPTEK